MLKMVIISLYFPLSLASQTHNDNGNDDDDNNGDSNDNEIDSTDDNDIANDIVIKTLVIAVMLVLLMNDYE